MRVLLITPMFPSKGNPAHGSFISTQIESIRKLKPEVSFELVANRNASLGFPHNLIKFVLLTIKSVVASIKGKFDLVHAHGIAPTGVIATIPSILRRRPLIITIHGSDLELVSRSPFWHSLARKSAARSSRIIAVSTFIKEEALRLLDVGEEKIKIIHIGVDRDVFAPADKESSRKKLGLPEMARIVIFVGNLIPLKGPQKLLQIAPEILEKVKESYFIFIGAGPLRETLEALSREKGIAGSVLFEGLKDQGKLSQWLSASDVLVLPSKREAFGLVALEAMACGVVPIVSSIGGTGDYVVDGENGFLIDPERREELTERILRLLEDRVLAEEIGRRAIETTRRFDRKVKSKQVYELYEKVCAETRSLRISDK